MFLCFWGICSYQLQNTRVLRQNRAIILTLMWNGACTAILDPMFCQRKIAAAGLAQGIERTVAKQAVKVCFRNSLMAREVFTIIIAEKGIVFAFPIHLASCHDYPPFLPNYSIPENIRKETTG